MNPFVPSVDMERLCSTIFLLLVVGSLIDKTLQWEDLDVHLDPKNVTVCEGDSVTLNCTFQPGGKHKVKLYYSPTHQDCNSATDTIHEMLHNRIENNDTWSTFNINPINSSDSGWYFCKVMRDIPVLEVKCSDGIQVHVDYCTLEYQNHQTTNSALEDLPTTFWINNSLQVEKLNVHLEPKNITVCEGDSVTLNCTFQPGGKHKVKWYYSPTNLNCNSPTDTIHEKLLIITKNNDTWSTLNTNPIKTSDSGWYFCKVTIDIPVLEEKCSDGIQVHVSSTCKIMACV